MSDIPNDLYQQIAGHGYDAGCECDLEGGDHDCKIQPPYESTRDYCQRIIRRVMNAEAKLGTAEALVCDLARALQAVDFRAGAGLDGSGNRVYDSDYEQEVCSIAQAALSRIPKEMLPK